ncbi:GGDEF domain-containing protein [Desulfobulbus elongatus]|uniref:GGDEF domain-containing protein n=1 Tax=Desulfobulbus elongatus TaxID=53332 RepID=UPI0006864774|nr:diguanylate cyclase [Desulfobulbus elongatus]
MRFPLLIVSQHLKFEAFFAEFPNSFETTVVTCGQDALAALARPTAWSGLLVAARLPDMDGLDLLEQAESISPAIPLLLVPDAEVAEFLPLANSRSVFRVVPESTPADILATILLDTVRQFDLVQREHGLQTRIDRLSHTDPLTGCYNRVHIHALLHRELRRSLRYRHSLSIILCDIDGLAAINEAFGHRAGDAVLTAFARAAEQAIRQDVDTIARWGGDEFLFVLPETPLSGAGRVATRLREQCVRLGCTVNGHALACNASFGVAGFVPETAARTAEAGDLLLIAERCLLQAKAAGGNQVLCCP